MATRGEGNQRLRPMTERCEHGIPAAVDGHFYAGIGENFSGANLDKADLSGANLTGANLTDTTVTAADLRGTKLDGVVGANFTGAILE